MAEVKSNIKLRKYEETAIDTSNPWEGDCLERKKAAEILGRVLRTIEQPFVVAINSQFGTGKSYFVKRLLQQFRNDGEVVLYFNAWEKDNQSQPLLSFVGELQSQFAEHYGIRKNRRSMKALTKGAGAYAVRKLLPGAVRIATAGLIGEEAIRDLGKVADELISGSGSLAEGLVQQQVESEKALIDFRKELEAAAADALKKVGGNARSVYVFVDELDRCRPPFALELLENIKHLFSVPGMVFILSIDRAHLKNSISTIYGAGMDGEGYLARFIDQNFQLPKPSRKEFAEFLFKRFGLDEVMAYRSDGAHDRRNIVDCFADFAELFELSLRHQEQAFAEINFVLRNLNPSASCFAPLLGQMAALKRYDYKIYDDYAHGRLQWDQLTDVISKVGGGAAWLGDRKRRDFQAWLVLGNQTDKNVLSTKLHEYSAQLNRLGSTVPHRNEVEKERQILEPRRDLFSRAHSIADVLSKSGEVLDGSGESPAEIIYKELELAADFGNK